MNSIRTHIHTFAYQEKIVFHKEIQAQTSVDFKNTRGVTLCLHTHRLIVNRFQAMRRPTGFTMDYSKVALDVDVWCPDVVVVVMCMCVCVCVCVCGGCSCWGAGGGKSRRILASISMGGPNLKS